MRSRIIQDLGLGSYAWLVPNYSALLTLALFAGIWVTLRECRHKQFPERHCYEALFWALLVILPGSRALYALQYADRFPNFWSFFSLSSGGLALYGGLAAALFASSFYLWRQRLPLATFSDALMPGLAFGLGIGRLGCFMAGCNFGGITHGPLGMRFPGPGHAFSKHLSAGLVGPTAEFSLPVHPTQLYESFFGFVAFLAILRCSRRLLSPGQLSLLSLSAYALFRFLLEYLRADSAGVRFGPLSFAQFVSLMLLAGSLSSLALIGTRSLAPEFLQLPKKRGGHR